MPTVQTIKNTNNNVDYIDMFSSSEAKPSITMVGLYNDDNECLMMGKLPRPFRRLYDLDTTFILRIDL